MNLLEYLKSQDFPETYEAHRDKILELARKEDAILHLDLDNRGCIVIFDNTGYRLVLRPIGPTAELLYKILVARHMGKTKLGEAGAPIQSSVTLSEQIDLVRKRKAEEVRKSLPAADVELDI